MQKPSMVFLDAGTVNYGDISLKSIESLGRLKIYNSSKPSEFVTRLKNAHIVILNKCVLDRKIFKALPQLRAVAVTATGTNNIDLEAAKQLGIAVMNVPGYSTPGVAQNTLALLLALAGNILKYNEASHRGAWSRSPFFVYGAYPIMELQGKTLGLLGYGAIGKEVGRLAQAFGMKLFIGKIPGKFYSKDKLRRVTFDQLIKKSDFISIHTPLTPLTQDLINAKVLRKMKRSAYLLNMARGGIVNEKDLNRALRSGWIRGAALDVLTQEPPPLNHILLGCPNLILTPHISWASQEARKRLVDEVAFNIRSFLQGKKRNRVA